MQKILQGGKQQSARLSPFLQLQSSLCAKQDEVGEEAKDFLSFI